MLIKLDHIDIKVADFEATVNTLLAMGLTITRRAPAPRNSVEMALPGENQVILEIHDAKAGGFTGIHHIAFKSDGSDLAALKKKGIAFKTENMLIKDTGRTVSSFCDANGLTWQLTD